MTEAPEKTARTHGAATRTYIVWRDDDDPVLAGEVVAMAGPAQHTSVLPFGAGAAVVAAPPPLAGDFLDMAGGMAPRTDAELRGYVSTLAQIWGVRMAARERMFGNAVNAPVAVPHFDRIRELIGPGVVVDDFRGRADFHSIALSALAHIAFTLGSVRQSWHEVLSAYVHEDDSEPTGLSYTDDAADCPPLPRNYANVEVRISGEDKVKPRRYSDEDHQVWRP